MCHFGNALGAEMTGPVRYISRENRDASVRFIAAADQIREAFREHKDEIEELSNGDDALIAMMADFILADLVFEWRLGPECPSE